uniref:Uncharacterized protein n=1 Tax=Anguilla anguilla TaxID=7936 RepID=A0A0E9Q1E2_ANGAN
MGRSICCLIACMDSLHLCMIRSLFIYLCH